MDLTGIGKRFAAGAIAGFLAAVAVDVQGLRKRSGDLSEFNLKIAARQWALGALAGGLAALGYGATAEVTA